jgi:hypothetical protein
MQLVAGRLPTNLPPRHIVTASSIAMNAGASADRLSRLVINHLSSLAAADRARPLVQTVAVA